MKIVGIGAALWSAALVLFCAAWYLLCAAGDVADGWRQSRDARRKA